MSIHWVFPITQDNLRICLKHEVIGARLQNAARIKKISPGDLIVFYVSKQWYGSYKRVGEFQAVVECTGGTYASDDNLWPSSGDITFPLRFPIKVISKKKCKIRPLVQELSFITNKKYYGLAFMGGVRQIPSRDFKIIMKAME